MPTARNTPRLSVHLPDNVPIVFSHAGLHPGNVLVSATGMKVLAQAIVDWESAGCYPAYWEWPR
ncbi:hypothetical protein DFH09DRAFT_1031966 [Mycena vulgaris]|nr:hypothetical protein DFH09DRAFT_1031966 [Mycena vulgaris]